MVTFIGEYTAKIDDRGRLVLPSAFKSLLCESGDVRLVVKKDLFAPCLGMFTFEEWERQSARVLASLNPFNEEHARFRREFMRGRAVVEPDPKFGRIAIPRKLLDAIGADKEVVFSGNDYKIELWSAREYEQSGIPGEEYLAIAAKLSQQ